ncbi:hypothetical protein, partial [Roseisolibacter sp. H3M3-2]|uniref:hypothetical protein n=1 Tax=Roseisolibacter sp. H3M3-2 TaxID=3031323 RepID=UPI0023DCCD49
LAAVAAPAADAGAEGFRAFRVERRFDAGGQLLEEAEAPLPAGAPDGRAFTAAPPDSLEARGYIVGPLDGAARFHAPDERALLSDGFARTHCFAPARGAGAESGWVGVRFRPVPGRAPADIDGVVWLDAATGEPRRVDYRYVWARLPREARGLGGWTEFARLADGTFVVRAWRIRFPLLLAGRGQLFLDGYRERGGEIRPAAGAGTR